LSFIAAYVRSTDAAVGSIEKVMGWGFMPKIYGAAALATTQVDGIR
jgi:hypothetical protein